MKLGVSYLHIFDFVNFHLEWSRYVPEHFRDYSGVKVDANSPSRDFYHRFKKKMEENVQEFSIIIIGGNERSCEERKLMRRILSWDMKKIYVTRYGGSGSTRVQVKKLDITLKPYDGDLPPLTLESGKANGKPSTLIIMNTGCSTCIASLQP